MQGVADREARLLYTITQPHPTQWAHVISHRGVHWIAGSIAKPDVEVRWSLEAAFSIVQGAWDGNTATAQTTILEDREGGRYVGPPPPMDFARQSELLSQLPHVPGATIRLACEYPSGPFGTTTCTYDFVDGQFKALRLGVVDGADVAVSIPFRQLVLLQQGRITVLDALAFGRVGGSQGALALMAGIVESAEYQCAMKASASGPGIDALATLGEVVEHAGYRRAMKDLLSKTTITP